MPLMADIFPFKKLLFKIEKIRLCSLIFSVLIFLKIVCFSSVFLISTALTLALASLAPFFNFRKICRFSSVYFLKRISTTLKTLALASLALFQFSKICRFSSVFFKQISTALKILALASLAPFFNFRKICRFSSVFFIKHFLQL